MTLFDGPDLQHVLEEEANKAVQRVQRLPDDDVLSVSVDDLTDRILATIDLEPPQLYPEQAGGARAWSGIEMRVPFSGTRRLFHYKPSFSCPAGPPPGLVVGDRVIVDLGPWDPEFLTRSHQWAPSVQPYLDCVRSDIETWREGLRDRVRRAVERRQADAAASGDA